MVHEMMMMMRAQIPSDDGEVPVEWVWKSKLGLKGCCCCLCFSIRLDILENIRKLFTVQMKEWEIGGWVDYVSTERQL